MKHRTGRYYFAERRRRLRHLPEAALTLLRRMGAGEELTLDTFNSQGTAIGAEKVHGTTVKCLTDRDLIRYHYGFPRGRYSVTSKGFEALALARQEEGERHVA